MSEQKITKEELKNILYEEGEKIQKYNKLELEQHHEDLYTAIKKLLDRKGFLVTDFNVGYTNILGETEENTTVQLKKPSGKYFTMYVDLEGQETKKEIKELAEFFVDQLRLNIEDEIKCVAYYLAMQAAILEGE